MPKVHTMQTLAQQIATAALKIAAVNHYLVGFDLVEAADLSFGDLWNAKQILIDMENADIDRQFRKEDFPKHQHRYDMAFMVLEAYCMRIHKCTL